MFRANVCAFHLSILSWNVIYRRQEWNSKLITSWKEFFKPTVVKHCNWYVSLWTYLVLFLPTEIPFRGSNLRARNTRNVLVCRMQKYMNVYNYIVYGYIKRLSRADASLFVDRYKDVVSLQIHREGCATRAHDSLVIAIASSSNSSFIRRPSL